MQQIREQHQPTVEWQIILRWAPPVFSDPFSVLIHFLSHPDYSSKYAVIKFTGIGRNMLYFIYTAVLHYIY